MDYNNQNGKYTEEMLDKYEKLIFRLMVILFDKYGVMVVDWMGFVLGLNKDGKPISQQSVDEIANNLNQLNEKLKDPRVREALTEAIRDSEPLLKEGLITILRVGTAGFNFVIKDFITLVCNESPAAPICGIFKLMDNTIDLGNELLESTSSSIEVYKNAKKWVDDLQTKMDKINKGTEGLTSFGSDYSNNLQSMGDTALNQSKDTLNQYSNNLPNNGDTLANQSKDTLNQYNDYAQNKLNTYGPLIPGADQYKNTLSDYNDTFQNSTDLANKALQDKTKELNNYAQSSVDNASSKLNDQMNSYKDSMQSSLDNASSKLNDQNPLNNMNTSFKQMGGSLKKIHKHNEHIKKRTRKSLKMFKVPSKKRR